MIKTKKYKVINVIVNIPPNEVPTFGYFLNEKATGNANISI